MRNLHIENSYKVWSRQKMKELAENKCLEVYGTKAAPIVLNRSWKSMYIEWYLHNFGYWVTRPFYQYNWRISKINLRCKHVDLDGH